jgi:hypothetical protein
VGFDSPPMLYRNSGQGEPMKETELIQEVNEALKEAIFCLNGIDTVRYFWTEGETSSYSLLSKLDWLQEKVAVRIEYLKRIGEIK